MSEFSKELTIQKITSFEAQDKDQWSAVIEAVAHLQACIHGNALAHGWWEGEQNDAEKIALMHSELSEVLEAMREGNPPSEKIPAYSSVGEELADCVIRVFDYAGAKKIDLIGAILAKHAYNLGRPYKHGKAF